MKILCIGDSLGLPREEVQYEDTWFFKVKSMYPFIEWIDYFQRGLLVNEAVQKFDTYYSFYHPDIVIWQSGICDCSPRYINDMKIFWRLLIKVTKKLKVESLFWKLIKKLFKRNPKTVYTPINDFEQQMINLIEKFFLNGAELVIIIKIGKASNIVLQNSPHINNNISKYNEVYDRIHQRYPQKVVVLDPLNKGDDALYVDGYHCNKIGMNKVLNSISSCLCQILHFQS